MKLIVAIVNNDDCHAVLSELSKNKFSATKLSTSGSFLRAGNATLLIGAADESVAEIIEIIKNFSSKRTQMVETGPSFAGETFMSMPIEVTVGGATVFVLDVDEFHKL
ncbi:MAG: transcriptional regulator [Clostridiales bacterium]|nr:transcriptional regulator [Clostridiales bacterium]